MKKILEFSQIFCFCFFIALSACGGGSAGSSSDSGGGTDVSALQVGEQVALVTAQENVTSSNESPNIAGILQYLVPTSGDYVNDETQYYVYDESMEALDMINEILCSLDQTRYYDFVNAGAYKALIDIGKCEGRHGGDKSGEESNQSSGQEKEFETWIVNATRADESSPQIVTFWIDEDADVNDSVSANEGPGEEDFEPDDGQIHARLTVTESSSETNLFGLFTIEFFGYDSTTGAETMKGYLSSALTDLGYIELSMVVDGSHFAENTHAILTPGEDSGVAHVERSMTVDDAFFGREFENLAAALITVSDSVDVAFDSNHYLTRMKFGVGEEHTACLDRQNFETNVWRYNLYAENGDRVELNAGMGIKCGGEHDYGWADYYGVWCGPDSVSDGQVVTDDEGENSYTIAQTQGRFIIRTRSEITLADLAGSTFRSWDEENRKDILVEWNDTEEAFYKVGEEQCDETGCNKTNIEPELLTIPENQNWLGIWKQGLGHVDLTIPEEGLSGLSNETVAPVYAQQFINPAEELTLYCYYQCPKAPLTETDFNTGNLFLPEAEDINNPYTYVYDPITGALTYNGEAVALEAGATIGDNSPNYWGMMSGALVTSTEGIENPWELWEQPTTYAWETGPNNWNKQTFLLDSNGDIVEFDSPLHCNYTHDEYGLFMLEYFGSGNLWGIPWQNEESNFEDNDFNFWRPLFAITSGSSVTCEGSTYYVKQMEVEQWMSKVDQSQCNDLALGNIQAADTSLVPTTDDIGEAPSITSAPAVIGGELQ